VDSRPSSGSRQGHYSASTFQYGGGAVEAANPSEPAATCEAYQATLYIQMQLCRSKTLKEWLRQENRVVDAMEARNIVQQVLLGLDHIHRKGYVHNDLKV
jgi:serine/threonine protein kinase